MRRLYASDPDWPEIDRLWTLNCLAVNSHMYFGGVDMAVPELIALRGVLRSSMDAVLAEPEVIREAMRKALK